MFSLSSRVALVTGGGTGIGAGIASGLASAGATVVLVGRRAPPLEATARKINDALADAAAPSRCHALPADILDLDAAGDIVAQAAALGGAPVSILLNNAGLNVRKPAHELTAADWRTSLDLMLTAPFFLARACAPAMSEARYGRILTIASLQSVRAFPNSLPYASAKSGVLGLTRALAEAYSPLRGFEGITANAIAPGFVRTELTAPVFSDDALAGRLAARTISGRNSEPDDLVGTAVFLSSPAAAYVNGQCLYVDGGFSALGER